MTDPTDPTLPTTADGYIDVAAADATPRIWDVDEIESIDGKSETEYSTTSSRDMQREWNENLEQGRQLFAMVIFPYVGRWLGKKASYWSKSLSLSPLAPMYMSSSLDVSF